MELAKYRCLNCQQSRWSVYSTLWRCESCGFRYRCTSGIPRLYLEETLTEKDRTLRDEFYDGFVGAYYRFVMPFLTLPARPLNLSWRDWIVFGVVAVALVAIVADLASLALLRPLSHLNVVDGLALAAALLVAWFFKRHPYVFFLFILAVPVRISLAFARFRPETSFADVHRQVIARLKNRTDGIRLLDVATGNCASLYKHGWMELDAQYTGVDLSETMLLQGLGDMSRKGVAVELALADASHLPFQADAFDVVTSYGAINGMGDPASALSEMVRVMKKGGVLLFLDEQLYPHASAIERLYFAKVLSSHNTVHKCPIELLPDGLADVTVHQVYQFYYICVAVKV